jgi:hypothetical protein
VAVPRAGVLELHNDGNFPDRCHSLFGRLGKEIEGWCSERYEMDGEDEERYLTRI